jgi:secondary thiamine-phosphate synthase enzyme
LITHHVLQALPEMAQIRTGLLHLFLQHTSASLCINENADPDVRRDLDSALDRVVPEDQPFTHTLEGPDDMPAHIKSTLVGCDLTIPIAQGRLSLGTWQGIYLLEHRDRGGVRQLVLTAWGRLG